nr:hypothetical protein Iba_chr08bCG11920 [Ipomoea batatas]
MILITSDIISEKSNGYGIIVNGSFRTEPCEDKGLSMYLCLKEEYCQKKTDVVVVGWSGRTERAEDFGVGFQKGKLLRRELEETAIEL